MTGVSLDELIGNIVEVFANNLRPKTSLPIRLISAASQPAAAAIPKRRSLHRTPTA
jgi:hypothetical protein